MCTHIFLSVCKGEKIHVRAVLLSWCVCACDESGVCLQLRLGGQMWWWHALWELYRILFQNLRTVWPSKHHALALSNLGMLILVCPFCTSGHGCKLLRNSTFPFALHRFPLIPLSHTCCFSCRLSPPNDRVHSFGEQENTEGGLFTVPCNVAIKVVHA